MESITAQRSEEENVSYVDDETDEKNENSKQK